jgi:hypothetical protein
VDALVRKAGELCLGIEEPGRAEAGLIPESLSLWFRAKNESRTLPLIGNGPSQKKSY